MRFSIVTPSHRNSDWLKLCIASVADQEVEHEHLVQDACSDDDTRKWLPFDSRVNAQIEKDRGMYDGINRGLRRASGEILAYLNCDEQYLPGALAAVDDYFQKHPQIEVVFADALVVDQRGAYLCERRASLPQRFHCMVSGSLAILTAATFFRRSVIDQRGILFNPALRSVGDTEWVLRLLEQKVSLGLLTRFTSAYTETGANLNRRPDLQAERDAFLRQAPGWVQRLRPVIVAHYRSRRLLAGHYWPRQPYTYSLFTHESPAKRVILPVHRPTFRWKA